MIRKNLANMQEGMMLQKKKKTNNLSFFFKNKNYFLD